MRILGLKPSHSMEPLSDRPKMHLEFPCLAEGQHIALAHNIQRQAKNE